jgi:plasmid rolling circle replication initiator protein Rep
MINEDYKIIEDLKNFDEPEFFVKKYNTFIHLLEKLQDVLSEDELKKIDGCGTYLKYAVFKDNKGYLQKKLIHANFCKSRWCSVCNWRRRIKYFNINRKKVLEVKKRYNAKFIFITLTTKNVYYKDLKKGLNEILKGFKRLLSFNRFRNNKAILGLLRTLEFTIQKNNQNYINLHIHCLVAVKPVYFDTKKNYYINQSELTKLWQKALNVDYVPIVDIRLVRKIRNKKNSRIKRNFDEEGAVFEVTKYLYKSIQLKDIDVDVLRYIVRSFKGVRLIAPVGVFRNKSKNEEKEVEEDLVKIGDDDLINGELLGEAVYILRDGKYELKDFKKVTN